MKDQFEYVTRHPRFRDLQYSNSLRNVIADNSVCEEWVPAKRSVMNHKDRFASPAPPHFMYLFQSVARNSLVISRMAAETFSPFRG